jgi:hypothetical protein
MHSHSRIHTFQSFCQLNENEEIVLDQDLRDVMMKQLEKHLILIDIYHEDIDLWDHIINATDPEEIDDLSLTIPQYLGYVKQTDSLTMKQKSFHQFMANQNGIGAGYDWDDLDDYPVSEYCKEFEVSEDDAILMKCLHDNEISATPSMSPGFEKI